MQQHAGLCHPAAFPLPPLQFNAGGRSNRDLQITNPASYGEPKLSPLHPLQPPQPCVCPSWYRMHVEGKSDPQENPKSTASLPECLLMIFTVSWTMGSTAPYQTGHAYSTGKMGAGRALTMQDMRFREELKWNLRIMVTVSFTPFLGLLSTPLSWLHPAATQHCLNTGDQDSVPSCRAL